MRAPESSLLCSGDVLEVQKQCYWSKPVPRRGLLPLLLLRWTPHELYHLKNMFLFLLKDNQEQDKITTLAIQGEKYGAKEVV